NTIESALVLVREHKARLAADPEVHRQIVEAARVGGIRAAREKAAKIIGPQGHLEVMMRALREANYAS
uniref:hypothetical protein n=1 Tax=Erythrobacter sp. TaxID=1042 RepID=UPI00311EC29E